MLLSILGRRVRSQRHLERVILRRVKLSDNTESNHGLNHIELGVVSLGLFDELYGIGSIN